MSCNSEEFEFCNRKEVGRAEGIAKAQKYDELVGSGLEEIFNVVRRLVSDEARGEGMSLI